MPDGWLVRPGLALGVVSGRVAVGGEVSLMVEETRNRYGAAFRRGALTIDQC